MQLHLEIETRFLFLYHLEIILLALVSDRWSAQHGQPSTSLSRHVHHNSEFLATLLVHGFRGQFELALQVMYVLENVVAALPTWISLNSAGVRCDLPFYLSVYILESK